MRYSRALGARFARPIGVVLLLGCAIGACGSGSGDAPSVSPSSPPASGDTATRTSTLDGKLSVPAGVAVTYFAKGVSGVRFMALSPDGVVYASQPGSGRVVRLPDANNDGVADSIEVVVS